MFRLIYHSIKKHSVDAKSSEGKELVKKGKRNPNYLLNKVSNSNTASEDIAETSPEIEVIGITQEKEGNGIPETNN